MQNFGKFLIVFVALSLAGCATAPKYPSKRPLTEQGIQTIGKTTVILDENVNGVEKSWFMANRSAYPFGLVGAVVADVMDAIDNSGPAKRAQKAAGEIAELISAEALNAGFVRALNEQVPGADSTAAGVTIGKVATVAKILMPDAVKDAVEISTSYTFSDDSRTLRFIARAKYDTDKIKYVAPDTKRQEAGPIYTNVFIYESTYLPIPTLTSELKERLIASIDASYKTESGSSPAPGSSEAKEMAKEIERAQNDIFDNDEIAVFLSPQWLRSNGELLKREIDNAHEFAAKYIVQDLNTTSIPRIDGQDEVFETLADQRTVRRIGSGAEAGSYVSSPGNVSAPATYGNTISISKQQSERIKALRDQARTVKSQAATKKGGAKP